MYKYKATDKAFQPLTETSQISPMKFRLLVEREEVLEEAGPLMKCTDYMNDVVAYNIRPVSFTMYGFTVNDSVVTRGDFFIAVTGYGSMFQKGLEHINKWLHDKGHSEKISLVEDVENKPLSSLIVRIPRYYCTNTAYMSLVMGLIRCATYSKSLEKINILDMDYKFCDLNKEGFDWILNPDNKKYLDDNVVWVSLYKYDKQGNRCGTDVFNINNWRFDTEQNYHIHNGGICNWSMKINQFKKYLEEA